MLTVNQLAKKCSVSVRTLHYYDAIGLLKPAQTTEAGYRLYDETALERLYLILLFRELGFALKDIRGVLDAPDFDRNRVLEQQIELLERKQRHLEYEAKSAQRTKDQSDVVNGQVMDFFVRLGTLKGQAPESDAVQAWVRELQAFLTENYYTCTPEILMSLGQMYAGGGAMTENIDAAGGEGTGAFALTAIECYCKK